MNLAFSSSVWKRPWPNLEEVSMNLRTVSSRWQRLECATRDWRSVRQRFFEPTRVRRERHDHRAALAHRFCVGARRRDGAQVSVEHREARRARQ